LAASQEGGQDEEKVVVKVRTQEVSGEGRGWRHTGDFFFVHSGWIEKKVGR